MNANRLKELKTFADDFYKKLNNSNEGFETYPSKPMKKSLSVLCPSITKQIQKQTLPEMVSTEPRLKTSKKKQQKISGNIYKTLLPWIPPNYSGKYFEDFKKLKDNHYMNIWEKVI